MKRSLLIAALGLLSAGSLMAQSKFDPRGRSAMDYYRMAKANPSAVLAVPTDLPFSYNPNSRSEAEVVVFVRLANGGTVADLEAKGFKVLSANHPSIITVQGTLEQILGLENFDKVDAVEFDQEMEPMCEVARNETKVASVHAGTGLPRSFTGKNVIAGVYDIGVDPNHINFRNSDGSTRVYRALHYYSSNGSFTPYPSNSLHIFQTDNTGANHGSHTLGCMAGSYNGPTTEYATATGIDKTGKIYNSYGMAPGSDIVAGCGQLYSTNYINYLEQIKRIKAETGKPAVVNFSFGSLEGSHDGTSLSSRQIENYAKDIPVFISSSNDGDENQSVVKTFTASDKQIQTCIWPNDGNLTGMYEGRIWTWAADNNPVNFKLVVYDSGQKKALYTVDLPAGSASKTIATADYTDESYIHNTNFNKAFQNSYITLSCGVNATNNRYYVRADCKLQFNSTSNSSRRYVAVILVEGNAGQHVDVMNNTSCTVGGYKYAGRFSSKNLAGFDDGTSDMSINELACGENAIVVGAYNVTLSWPKLNGQTGRYNSSYQLGEVSGYSSYGILHDGRTLPHFVAPGTSILASGNNFYGAQRAESSVNVAESDRNNFFFFTQGTSMSSPVAAGVGAVIMEADPTLTPARLRQIIVETCTKDSYVTNAAQPARWGAGKINALEAVKKALQSAGINDITVDGQRRLVLESVGDNIWQATLPGMKKIDAGVYSIAGQLTTRVSANEESVTIDLSGCNPGVYIINVNGNLSEKVYVK